MSGLFLCPQIYGCLSFIFLSIALESVLTNGKWQPFFCLKVKTLSIMEIKIFNNDKFGEIRVADEKFCLNDVCKILSLSNVTVLKQRLNPKGLSTTEVLTAGGNQSMIFIDEPNLYRCIFQSRKPTAEKFQDWVTSEVLPAIRRTGGYMAARANETPEEIMARALILAQSTIDAQRKRADFEAQRAQILEGEKHLLEIENKQLAPKADYFDSVLQSAQTYTMTQVAKELGMSAITLEKKLNEGGVIFKQSGQWLLYAKYQGRGYTRPRTHHFKRSDGSVGSNTITVWAESGREFIHSLFTAKN